MIYLSGHVHKALPIAEVPLGVMLTPRMRNVVDLTAMPWAADTGLFSAKGEQEFVLQRYTTFLQSLAQYRSTNLFATAPDAFDNRELTLQRALPVLPIIRELGYKAAYVAHAGSSPANTPWDALDVLFIGGSNSWQWSAECAALIRHARSRNLPVHRGRVNTEQRIRMSHALGCTSADGTLLRYGPDINLPKLLQWLRRLHGQQVLMLDA